MELNPAGGRMRAALAWVRFALLLLPIMAAGCVSLTPEQSASLKEAQRFADEVTSAYGVHRVKVVGDSYSNRGYASFFVGQDVWPDWPGIPDSAFHGYAVYRPGAERIFIQPFALNQSSDARLALVKPLALATLQRLVPSGGTNPANAPREWTDRYDDYRRGVEIMVKFSACRRAKPSTTMRTI